MRILVTGASGFIGAHLVRRLNGEGHGVFVLPSPRFRGERLAGIAHRVVEHAGDAGAEVVYHLASTPLEASISDAEHERVIVGGMRKLLDELRTAAPPRRLVIAGSAAEYGSGHDWREEDAVRPDTKFGVFKRTAGGLACASGIASVQLRIFTPYGEGEPASRLVPSVLRSALGGQPVRLRSTGAQTRDYVHASDLIDALIEAGRRPLEAGVAINVCSGVSRRVMDVAKRIVALAGSLAAVEPGLEEPAVLAQSSGHPGRAAALLGWQPRIDFDEGLLGALRWWKEQQTT